MSHTLQLHKYLRPGKLPPFDLAMVLESGEPLGEVRMGASVLLKANSLLAPYVSRVECSWFIALRGARGRSNQALLWLRLL